MNVPVLDGRLLRLLTETIGAKHVVEVGTSNGYSGIWLGLALQKTGGKLATYEIDADRASLARENFKRAGVDEVITLVEGDAHENVKKIKEPIDLLFLDADKEGYVDYLNKLLPLVRPGGLIVGHNINQGACPLPGLEWPILRVPGGRLPLQWWASRSTSRIEEAASEPVVSPDSLPQCPSPVG